MTVLERDDNNIASLESVAFVQAWAIVWDTLDFFKMYKHVFLYIYLANSNLLSLLLNAA